MVWSGVRGTAIVQVLIKHKADVNVTSRSFGETPLHWAGKRGDVQTAALLVDAKANLRVRQRECV